MLTIDAVSKTFNPGTVNEKKALDHVSLSLADGDFATIVGSNGAGKSTLFNAITGSFYVDEGRIILGGEDITYTKEHTRSKVIGHLFQDPLKGTAPHMTIEENMALAYLRASTARHAYFSRISAKEKAVPHGKNHCRTEYHLPDGDPQHASGPLSREPYPHDGRGTHRISCVGG